MISYAQNLEDVVLARALSDVSEGKYIDVGANHPKIDSVTRYFYDNGWSGINVEPIPDMHSLLMENRPRDVNLQVAAGAQLGEVTINHAVEYSGLSSINDIKSEAVTHLGDVKIEQIVVAVTTLNTILKQNPMSDIHFLKIDVEGFEKAVLEGIDFSVHRPWIVVVEATMPNSQIENFQSWETLLTSSDYELVYRDGLNRFYLAKEHSRLSSRFTFPPNIFDSYQRADFVELLDSRDRYFALYNQTYEKYQKYRNSIETSISWRITRPLRAIQKLFKRLF